MIRLETQSNLPLNILWQVWSATPRGECHANANVCLFLSLYLKELFLLVPHVLLVGRRLHVQVVSRPRQDLPPGDHLAAVGRAATESREEDF